MGTTGGERQYSATHFGKRLLEQLGYVRNVPSAILLLFFVNYPTFFLSLLESRVPAQKAGIYPTPQTPFQETVAFPLPMPLGVELNFVFLSLRVSSRTHTPPPLLGEVGCYVQRVGRRSMLLGREATNSQPARRAPPIYLRACPLVSRSVAVPFSGASPRF